MAVRDDTWGVASILAGVFAFGAWLGLTPTAVPFALGAALAGLASSFFARRSTMLLAGILINAITLILLIFAAALD